jgi:translation initiation factor IF-1
MPKEYIIYCDESEKSGRHFSNFYGGVLISSDHIDEVRSALAGKKVELNLFNEVKWTKITDQYEEKYKELMTFFFGLVRDGKIKVRIMFTQNTHVALNLSKRHKDESYFILYYMFLKHAFGLMHSPSHHGVQLRIYPDQLPDTKEQVARFRNYLRRLETSSGFARRGIRIREDDIVEVVSHDHDVLQCLDIVLGAIQSRLNDVHLERPKEAKRRGKRTLAKERVYKHVNRQIREIYPHFNVGISTGKQGDITNLWRHPYRHWLFSPTERLVLPGSKKKKKAP